LDLEDESLIGLLRHRLAAAVAEVVGARPHEVDPVVRPATDPAFGDYQCNAALTLAKTLRRNPRELACRIVSAAQDRLQDLTMPLEVAGPGFINIRLRQEFLSRCLGRIAPPPDPSSGLAGAAKGVAQDRVGLPLVKQPLRVVVEYSQPNIAKQMHVGHLRSTILGDVFARVLSFLGHEVIRQNHIGDWGTQFGMLIRWYREHALPTPQTHADVLEAIEEDYRAAQKRFDEDEEFARQARLAVAELQSGQPEARRIWEQICAESRRAFTEIYERLGVLLAPEDIRGESFYNDRLPAIVQELLERFGGPEPSAAADPDSPVRAQVREDQGAVVVYLYDRHGRALFRNPDGQILGMIVRKSDGGYLYATTDLAALRFRLKELRFSSGIGAQRIIYVTDARQKLHFEMFFAAARAAGWIPPGASVEHVMFGSVLGEDRRPLRTRSGQNVKLRELLDEAERRAAELLERREQQADEAEGVPYLTDAEKRHIARCVGIAAVKYADLRNDRRSDYIFNWDKMLSLQGNTAPYLLYAYARIRSIYRRASAGLDWQQIYRPEGLHLADPTERALALRLAQFRETVEALAADLEPHVLCNYLYELAGDFMRFYESCPVLQAPDEPTRLSRLRLCDLAARTLRLGLYLLGIKVLERM